MEGSYLCAFRGTSNEHNALNLSENIVLQPAFVLSVVQTSYTIGEFDVLLLLQLSHECHMTNIMTTLIG